MNPFIIAQANQAIGNADSALEQSRQELRLAMRQLVLQVGPKKRLGQKPFMLWVKFSQKPIG